MIFGSPATAQFLAAVQRLKQQQQRKQMQTRQARERVRNTLRKALRREG